MRLKESSHTGWGGLRCDGANVDSSKHFISNGPTDYSVRELCIGEQLTKNTYPPLSTVQCKIVQGQKFMCRLGKSKGGDMLSARTT